ncbi:MAG: GNAT family N-acetyltransferase, partial [Pseudomonadota bacterium]
PGHQRKGLGKLAIAAVEAEARNKGAKALSLYTAQPHTDLVASYSVLGFQVIAVGPSPSGKDTIPRIYMSKPLN